MTHIHSLYYKNGLYFKKKSANYKDGYDFGPSAAHMYPLLGQVPPSSQGITFNSQY